MARVITARAQCPAIDVDGASIAMTVRMPAETIPVRPSRPDLPPPKASVFPVTTCEATIPVNARRVRASTAIRCRCPRPAPRRIVLLGDTGCRIVPDFDIFQACDDPIAWPFERVANAAAAIAARPRHPRRRLSLSRRPMRPRASRMLRKPVGLRLGRVAGRFFQPARKLFAAAPWIVVRGNHESCNRAGQGWWRFMDPRPVMPRQDCNVAADDDIGNYSAAVRRAVRPRIGHCSSSCSIRRGWA